MKMCSPRSELFKHQLSAGREFIYARGSHGGFLFFDDEKMRERERER